jgi:Phytanoyl-CoA dioxygenase (PhyH)
MSAATYTGPLSASQIKQFNDDGYLIVNGLLDPQETQMVLAAARADHAMIDHAFSVDDTAGRKTRISLWNHPGDDIYGMVSRCHKVVDSCEQLMGDEVYHYHSKMLLKEPRVGGAWEWHQDYGYWYSNHCLYPDMLSVFIALDPATKANGCMQIIKGSHKLGRIEHGRFGKQTGADPERVKHALERLEHAYCEMDPGDGLFFHALTLHCSAPNNSDKSRWAVICCYNTKHNDPYAEAHHPRYTPLEKVPDSAIKETGAKVATASQTSWLDPAKDETIGADDYDR